MSKRKCKYPGNKTRKTPVRTDVKPVHRFRKTALAWIWRLILWIWKPIVGSGVILGVVTGLYSMSSHLSVAAGLPSDPNNPFSAPFELRNEGYLAVHDVNFICGVREIENTKDSKAFNLRTEIERPVIPVIAPGEATVTYCKFFWRSIAHADITVEVKYHPKFLLWQKEKYFRYVATKDSTGRFSWSPRALSE